MHPLIEILLHHGYLLLAVWVFLEQIGLPLPSLPLLLAAGALCGMGHMNFAAALLACAVPTLVADVMWYELGRNKGLRVVQLLCRISLAPDSCVRRTEGIFDSQGARSLLFAKFVPGLSAVTMPLAGIFRMPLRRFLIFDLLGVVLWLAAYIGLGYFFTDQIELIADHAKALGSWVVVVLLAGLVLYILYKFWARQRFLHNLRVNRISVDELKQKIDSGEPLSIVDLRHALDIEADPETIPGAVQLNSKDLTEKSGLLPLDREVVVYCT
jgi:membrane protein DedA with SNARE-associated domain